MSSIITINVESPSNNPVPIESRNIPLLELLPGTHYDNLYFSINGTLSCTSIVGIQVHTYYVDRLHRPYPQYYLVI
jgi:hypothetical protein